MPFPCRTLLIPVFWGLWCTLHSILIAPPVTALAQKRLGAGFRVYRIFFNAFSLLTLLPLTAYSFFYPEVPIFRWSGLWVIIQYGLIGTGLTLLWAGGHHYSLSQFLGVRQIQTGRTDQTLMDHSRLDFSGIHRVIRHPWYAAGMLLIWARDITWSILLTNIVMDIYFVVGTVLEERKLLKTFGTQYADYQKQVSMLFPYRYLKDKMKNRL
jgi:methanethiol S-methyltransferase